MQGRRLRLFAVLAVLGTVLLTPATASGDDAMLSADVSALRQALMEEMHSHAPGGSFDRAPLNKNMEQVGHLDLASTSISDVWAHGDYAYLAGLGGTPVQIVDISDPANPAVVATAASPDPFCSSQDVKVETVNTRYFKGDLMAVAGERCFSGLQLWDVSDPTQPELLSAINALDDPGQPEFIHNVYIFEQGNRAYVIGVSGFFEVFSLLQYGFTLGDVLVVDVTDPENPQTVGDWGAGKDGGLAYGTPFFPPFFPPGSDCTPPPGGVELCRGDDFPGVVAHDVWVNEQGTIAYVSYWDAGVVVLDVSDPTDPTSVGVAFEPLDSEGNAHVAVPAHGGNLLVVGDEDFTAEPWGFMRFFDTSDPSNPVEVGTFATDNSLNHPQAPFPVSFSAHNVIVRGNRAFISWYNDGIRVLDFAQPDAVREIAAFTPGGNASFWGVYVHHNLVLGSDVVGGDLYILQVK